MYITTVYNVHMFNTSFRGKIQPTVYLERPYKNTDKAQRNISNQTMLDVKRAALLKETK